MQNIYKWAFSCTYMQKLCKMGRQAIGQANIQQPKHLKVLVHNVLAQPNIGPKLKLQMKMNNVGLKANMHKDLGKHQLLLVVDQLLATF